jgi:hypothetical protein
MPDCPGRHVSGRAGAKEGKVLSRWTVETCFDPLLGWVLSWWQGTPLALAFDATILGASKYVCQVWEDGLAAVQRIAPDQVVVHTALRGHIVHSARLMDIKVRRRTCGAIP